MDTGITLNVSGPVSAGASSNPEEGSPQVALSSKGHQEKDHRQGLTGRNANTLPSPEREESCH